MDEAEGAMGEADQCYHCGYLDSTEELMLKGLIGSIDEQSSKVNILLLIAYTLLRIKDFSNVGGGAQ